MELRGLLPSQLEREVAAARKPGGHLPAVSDDGGTPFAVVVIPVDDKPGDQSAAIAVNLEAPERFELLIKKSHAQSSN